MEDWTESWFALLLVVGLVWQVVPQEILDYLITEHEVTKIVKEDAEHICNVKPRVYTNSGADALVKGKVIDNGTVLGTRKIRVKNGRVESLEKYEDSGAPFVTTGLIDAFGVDQDGVTLRILDGNAVKSSGSVVRTGYVRMPEDAKYYQRSKQLWINQQLWCKKGDFNQPIPVDPKYQEYVNWFQGLKVDTSVGGENLLLQAQLLYQQGKSSSKALRNITNDLASSLNLENIGRIAPGYDADLVVWDRHPLKTGATPVEIYIDGHLLFKKDAMINSDPLRPFVARATQHLNLRDYVITGIRESHVSHPSNQVSRSQDRLQLVVQGGEVLCFEVDCRKYIDSQFTLSLEQGYILPTPIKFTFQPDTTAQLDIPSLSTQPRAKDAFVPKKAGYGIDIPPESQQFFRGYSVFYRGPKVLQELMLHVSIPQPSAVRMAWLRQFNEPVVVHTNDRVVIQRLIELKRELKKHIVVFGGGEAHLIARDLAKANIPLVLTSPKYINVFYDAGVKLGFHGNRFELGQEAGRNGILYKKNDILDMLSWNLIDMFNINADLDMSFMVSENFGLEIGSQVAAVVEDGILKIAWPQL